MPFGPRTVHTVSVVLLSVTGSKPVLDVADTVPLAPTFTHGVAPKLKLCAAALTVMDCVVCPANA